MKRLFATLIVAALTLMPSFGWSQNFPLAKIMPSVVPMYSPLFESVGCTAFSMGDDYFATASHCLPEGVPVTVYGKEFQVVQNDSTIDIAVFRTKEAVNVPALRMGPKPKQGDWVLSLGYLSGRQSITFFPGMVLHTDDPQFGFGSFVTAGHSGTGMSGGPVVDGQGRVVSIHLCRLDPTDAQVAPTLRCSAGYDTTKKALAKYIH